VIGIERVDFVSVATRDVARSRWFYGELLGLPRSPTNPDEFEAANVTLTLWEPETQHVPFAPNRSGVALRVPDVNAAREQLAAKGVEFLGDTVDTGVCLMGFFSDPEETCSSCIAGTRRREAKARGGCAAPQRSEPKDATFSALRPSDSWGCLQPLTTV
jgi:predicted enzyme related to lactoylglutathione lyase